MRRVLVTCAIGAALAAGCNVPGANVAEAGPPGSKAMTSLAALRPPAVRPVPLDLTPPTDTRAAELLREARLRTRSGQYAVAVPMLLQALAKAPDSIAVRRELGLAYAALGEIAKARSHLNAADGDDVAVQMSLGRMVERIGRLDLASLRYRRALACTDAETTGAETADLARVRLTDVLYQQGYLIASLAVITQLEQNIHQRDYASHPGVLGQLTEHPETLSYRQARMLFELGRYDEAADAADVAYGLNKTYLAACQFLTKALARTQRRERAYQVAVEMLSGPLRRDLVMDALLDMYRVEGDAAAPARLLAAYKASHTSLPAPTLTVLAWATRTLGDADGATAMLADNIASVEQPVSVGLTLSDWLIADGKLLEAQEILARLLVREPTSYRRIAVRIRRTPRHYLDDDAVAALADAAAADISASRHLRLYVTGLLLARIGQGDRAETQFGEAVKAAGSFAPAYEALAGRLIARKRYPPVVALASMLQRNGKQTAADFLRGWADLSRNRNAESVEMLKRVAGADPTHVSSRVLIAQASIDAGKWTEAEKHLREAIALTRDDEAVEYLFEFSMARYRRELRVRNAEGTRKVMQQLQADLEELVGQEPADPLALWLLGGFQLNQRKYDQANDTVGRLMTLVPDHRRTRLLKVGATTRGSTKGMGPRRFATVMADLDVAILSEPSNLAAWRLKSQVLAGRANYVEAAEALAIAQRLAPGDTDLKLQRAIALHHAGRFDQAADLLAGASERNPKWRILYVDSLIQNGQASDAVAKTQRWVTAEPMNLFVRAALPYAQQAAGDTAAALESADAMLAQGKGDTYWHLQSEAAKMSVLARAGRYDELIAFAGEWTTRKDVSYWAERAADGAKPMDLYMLLLMAESSPAQQWKWRPMVNSQTPVGLASGWLIVVGRYEQAVECVRTQIAGLDSDDPVAAPLAGKLRLHLMRQLVWAGQRGLARDLYPALVGEDQRNVDLLAFGAALYTEPTEADQTRYERLLTRAVELRSDDALLMNNLAYAWVNRGVKLNQAQRMLREAVTIDSASHIQDSLGWLRYKKGEFRPALDWLLMAINGPGGDEAALYDHAGDTYWRLGRVDEAVAMWNLAADLATGTLDAVGDLADDDTRRVAAEASLKTQAATSGKRPNVAPLGVGVRP